MTMQALQGFAEQARSDPAMAAAAARAVDGLQGTAAAEALAGFARERGFAVEAGDLAALERGEGELSDGELDAVAGGNGFLDFLGNCVKNIPKVFG